MGLGSIRRHRLNVTTCLLVTAMLLTAGCGGGSATSLATGGLLQPSAAGGGGVGGNEKPVAVPAASPTEGTVPQLVHLYADGSYDPDGEILKWEWKFDSAGGDMGNTGGWIDYTHTKGDVWHTFRHPGTVVAHLRVTDDDGRTATAFVKVELVLGGGPDVVDSLKVIDPSDGYILESIEDGTFTFSLLPMADPTLLAEDDIVIFMYDGGYLRIVESVAFSNYQLIVETSPAALSDVFINASFDHTFSMAGATEEPPKAGAAVPEGVSREVSDWGEIGIDLSGTTLYENGGLKVEVTNGSAQFTPSIDIGADFDWFELTHFHTTATGELTFEFDVTATADWAAEFKKEVTLLTVNKPFAFSVGPVPIVGVAHLSFVAGIQGAGSFHGEAGWGFDSTASVTVGAEYNDGVWSPIAERNWEFNEHPPYIEADIDTYLRAYVRPELEVEFYSTLAPKINVEPYLKFSAKGTLIPIDISWQLLGGATSDVFFKIEIFSYKVADFNTRILDWSVVIAEGRIAGPHITAVEPLSGGSGDVVTFKATNDGAEATAWEWGFGGGADPPVSTEESPLVTLGDPGTYDTCYVTAINDLGVSTFEFELTITTVKPNITAVQPLSGASGAEVTFAATNNGAEATSWEWYFGDGADPSTSTEKSPTVTLGDAGTYGTCYVTAENDRGESTFPFVLTVTAKPNITAVDPLSGASGAQVTFTATNDGAEATSWQWYFGGGANPPTSAEESPTVTLGSVGSYDSCYVTAKNDAGESHFPFVLTVATPAPNITAVNPLDGVSGQQVTFTATNDGGEATSWEWYFGGGANPPTSTEESPTVMLGAEGTYYACYVTAQNDQGTSHFPFELTVTSDTQAHPWQMYGRNALRTRRSPYTGPQSSTVKWFYECESSDYHPASVFSSPAVASDGTIYIASDVYKPPSYVYALNPDGSLKWKYQGSRGFDSSPAIGEDGTVYIGSYDKYLYALNPNGQLKWRFLTDGQVDNSPAISNTDTIFVHGAYKLYAINPDGTLQWTYTAGSYISGSSAIGENGVIYFGDGDGYFYALNQNGTLKWKSQQAGSYFGWGSPAINSNGTIHAACCDGTLYAFNPDDGNLVWTFETYNWGFGSTSPCIGTDDTVYVACLNGYVYALNPDGTLKWKTWTDVCDSSPALDGEGTLYISNTDSPPWGKETYFYAIASDGTIKWRHKWGSDQTIEPDQQLSSPAIGEDGTVYVGYGAFLYAFGPGG